MNKIKLANSVAQKHGLIFDYMTLRKIQYETKSTDVNLFVIDEILDTLNKLGYIETVQQD